MLTAPNRKTLLPCPVFLPMAPDKTRTAPCQLMLMLSVQERLNLLERLEQRPLKVRPKEDYERIVRGLSAAELDSMIDLRPFMQRNPFVVQADANLSRTYRLFRTMGLRHLFVGPPQPKVPTACPCLSHAYMWH